MSQDPTRGDPDANAADGTPPDDPSRTGSGRGPWRRRRVLIGALAFMLAGWLLYFASPWILPLSIVEGPLVQQAQPTSVRIVWYTSRPAKATLELTTPGGRRSLEAERSGRRARVQVDGLSPGEEYAYRVAGEGRELGAAVVRTAKPPGRPFRFIVFGDSGRASREQFALAARMTGFDPDFLLHTGDLIYGAGQRSRYRARFFVPYREMIARVAFWPSLGNHDVARPELGAGYREVFELPENGPEGLPPEANYWFDYADARFVVLDSNGDERIEERGERGRAREANLRERIAPWIERAFADAPPWRIAVFHHPPYTAGAYAGDDDIQRSVVPALERAGVQLVFNGHDHMYQRSHPLRGGAPAPAGRGIVYVVTGAGGAKLYKADPADPRRAWIAALDNSVHSFTLVDADTAAMRLRQVAIDGRVLDDFTLPRATAE